MAQSSEGATVYNLDECQGGFGELVCSKGRVVFNSTLTPSGLLSVNLHVDVDTTRTGGACEPYDVSDKHHQHTLFDIDAVMAQEDHFVGDFSSNISCSGGPLLGCEHTVMVHQVDGTWQFDRNEMVCTEE